MTPNLFNNEYTKFRYIFQFYSIAKQVPAYKLGLDIIIFITRLRMFSVIFIYYHGVNESRDLFQWYQNLL